MIQFYINLARRNNEKYKPAHKLEFSERQVIFNLMETCGMQAEELLVESEAWIYGCIFKIKKYLMA